MAAREHGFAGVPPDAVYAYGELFVVSGLVEGVAHDILDELGGHIQGLEREGAEHRAVRDGLNDVLGEIKRLARLGLPEHARIEARTIQWWCGQVKAAMREERHQRVHSSALKVKFDGEWVPAARHLRTDELVPIDAAAIHDAARRLHRLWLIGLEVTRALRHQGDGVWASNYSGRTIRLYEDKWRPG